MSDSGFETNFRYMIYHDIILYIHIVYGSTNHTHIFGENHIIELDDGKIYRKALYLMVKTMVSCRFSLKPIHWVWHIQWQDETSASTCSTSRADAPVAPTPGAPAVPAHGAGMQEVPFKMLWLGGDTERWGSVWPVGNSPTFWCIGNGWEWDNGYSAVGSGPWRLVNGSYM